jgi:hypothetical protein
MEYNDGQYRPALRKILVDALEGQLRTPARQADWILTFTDDPALMEAEYRAWINEYVRPGNSWR